MGLTRFKGPVYGAKTLLWAYGPATEGSSGASSHAFGGTNNNASRTIPPYEDWYLTEVFASCSTCSSASCGLTLKVEGGSTTIAPNMEAVGNGSTRAATLAVLTNGVTSTTWSTWATITGDAGEYEGAFCPAGSSLRMVSSGGTLMSGVIWQVMGFIRHRSSTRVESV